MIHDPLSASPLSTDLKIIALHEHAMEEWMRIAASFAGSAAELFETLVDTRRIRGF